MINRTVLIGRLTDNLEVKQTNSGVSVATFNLAVNRQFKNANGEREADFIRCQIWRKGAEILAQYTQKGSQIGVDGRIQTRSYENQQGNRVYVTEVIVENFSLLDSKGYSSQSSSDETETNNNDPFKKNGQAVDISDDDLPF